MTYYYLSVYYPVAKLASGASVGASYMYMYVPYQYTCTCVRERTCS